MSVITVTTPLSDGTTYHASDFNTLVSSATAGSIVVGDTETALAVIDLAAI